MPDRAEVFYFGAGPSPLPTSVLEQASQSVVNHNNLGLSLLEQSHRSALSSSILANASDSLRQILHIPVNYEVLFMAGGGTTQFSAIVYNLFARWAILNPDRASQGQRGKCQYLVTGGWSAKAAEESQRLVGKKNVNVVFDARESHPSGERKFGSIPRASEWQSKLTPAKDTAFVYYCDNETVDGVEWPAGGPPASVLDKDYMIVADMSSNILSRRVDVSRFGVIFAGAQKNIGSTGVTIVIMRKDILEVLKQSPSPDLDPQIPVTPIMMHYPTIAKAGSLYNTLPIFDVYIASLTMEKLIKDHGGGENALERQEELSGRKAKIIYDLLDKWAAVYKVVPQREYRSRMNICLNILKGSDQDFLKGAEAQGLTGLKGHRSVGGIRISNYNAVPLAAIEKLAKYVEAFAESVSN